MAAGLVYTTITALSLVTLVQADLTPTAPGPGETFYAGSNCTIKWDTDQGGSWTNVSIDLMSGSNTNMSWVTNVASALDGTDPSLTPFNWTCPEVDPYSTIYFYQFTNNGQIGSATWTTRFTIASLDGQCVRPPNAAQPNGDPVPWGVGQLAENEFSSTMVDAFSPGNIMRLEQMNAQDLHSAQKTGIEDHSSNDDSHSSDEEEDNNEDEDNDNDSDSDSDDVDRKHHAHPNKPLDHGSGDSDTSGSSRSANSSTGDANKADDSDSPRSQSQSTSKAAKSSETPKAEGSSAADASAAPLPKPKVSATIKPPAKSDASSASSDTHASNAAVGSIPTPSLPVQRKVQPATNSGSSPIAPAVQANKPSGTCQCSSHTGQQAGLKMSNGSVEREKVSPWIQLYPLLIVLYILY